jgi:CRP/FNR family cyclic AMP-dependent transcriptional regulator
VSTIRYQPGQPLFTEGELASLVKLIEERTGRPVQSIRRGHGHTFFLEGEPGDFALLIQKGHVKVLMGTPSRIVAVRDPGEVVGEMAALSGEGLRSASIVAWNEVEVLALPGEMLWEFLGDHPRAMRALFSVTAERTAQASRKIVESELAVKQQLAKEIIELVDKGIGHKADDGTVILNSVTQEDLASLVGTKKIDSVKKVIRQLKDAEIIVTGRQMITIIDLPALRSVSTGELVILS